ncbi:MAG: hypothetical protein ACYCYH_02995, partial [Steroidobacteraceae bacterium]
MSSQQCERSFKASYRICGVGLAGGASASVLVGPRTVATDAGRVVHPAAFVAVRREPLPGERR